MKKRAVLFLLVLCAALCLAFSAMAAKYPSSAPLILGSNFEEAEILQALEMKEAHDTKGTKVQLENGDYAHIQKVLNGQDVIIGNGTDTLYVIYNFVSYINPTKITIKKGVTLQSSHNSGVVIECPVDNYGTIDSFTHQGKIYNTATYSGTIQNRGTISGGTFTGTVINMPDGTITGGDFSKARLYVQDASGTQTEITAPSSEHPEFNNAWITVTLDLDGGTLPEGAATTQTIRRGASLTSAAPTKEGKQFAYWEDQHGYHYSNDAISCLHNDTSVSLTAVWCDFLVIYKTASPESGTIDMGKTMLPQAFNIDETKALENCIFSVFASDKKYNSPYPFYCWNTRTDGLGKNYFVHSSYPFTATESGSITLYPRWLEASIDTELLSVQYRYDENSTTFHSVTTERDDGIDYHKLLSPTDANLNYQPKRGKEFAGWLLSPSMDLTDWIGSPSTLEPYDEPDEPEIYQPGEQIQLAVWENPYPYQQNKEIVYSRKTVITAKWNPLPVTEITFDANGTGVTGDTEKGTYFKGETLPLPKNGFTRTDYTFTGWNTKADGTGTGYGDGANITIEGDALVGKNVTLYAQWKSNKPETPTPQPETPTPQPETPTPTPTQRPVPPTAQPTNPPPQTGDASNQPLWLALCMASVVAMVALVVMKKRSFSQR